MKEVLILANEIMVSVICNAYNHERYIRDALDGFLMQKTNFAFEVLIHDDASTDKTADIIREYEAKYPDIIKPIYQTENQYSKDPSIVHNLQMNRVNGKYIAFCEGDDYWIHPLKLQRQVTAMEKHPEVDMCAHSALRVNATTKATIDIVTLSHKDAIIPVRDVILGKGGYVPNATLLYRKTHFGKTPKFLQHYPIDYFAHIQAALRGGVLYLSDSMAAYRWLAVGSWTRSLNANPERFVRHKQRIIDGLNILDAETDYQYTKTIHKAKMQNLLHLYRETNRLNQLLKPEGREIFQDLPLIAKLEIVLKNYIPGFAERRAAYHERKIGKHE